MGKSRNSALIMVRIPRAGPGDQRNIIRSKGQGK